MAVGRVLGMERVDFKDSQTRAHITQLTSNVTMSQNLYFEETAFTPDCKRVIFISRSSAARGAPYDLYRVNVDGSELVQLTDRDGFGDCVLAVDGERAFYTAGTDVRGVYLDDARDELVASFGDAEAVTDITVGGEFVFVRVVHDESRHALMRIPVEGGEPEIIYEGGMFCHVTANPSGQYISWVTERVHETREGTWRVMRTDGTDERAWPAQRWTHSSWIGDTDRMQGGLLPPDRALTWAHPHDSEQQVIAEGAYFVHSSATPDAEWIVSDTNWPNIGLQLIHVPSGRWDTICLDQASFGHPQYTHPHPDISPDGRYVLYNSDRTGVPQVYIVTIPDWLRDELRTGEISNRHRIGPRKD
jgi:oligogalacturonide lyase